MTNEELYDKALRTPWEYMDEYIEQITLEEMLAILERIKHDRAVYDKCRR